MGPLAKQVVELVGIGIEVIEVRLLPPRALTAKGERQARAAGAALALLGAHLDTCLTSPKARAVQTAEIACEALDLGVEVAPELAGGRFDAHALAAVRGAVLLVGHEPDFSAAVNEMTGARIEFKKGGLAAVEGEC